MIKLYILLGTILEIGLIFFFIWYFDKAVKSVSNKNYNHEFKPKDVVNLKIDPKCVICGKKLSECKK